MNAFLILALTNAVLATGMFAIVAACKSRIRNPAVLHWLWILVLLKLLTPPLWSPQWALLPAVEPAAGALRGYDRFSPHESWCGVRSASSAAKSKRRPLTRFNPKASSITRPRNVCRRATHDQTVGVASLRPASAHCCLSWLSGALVLCCCGGYQCGESVACSATCDLHRRRRWRSSRRRRCWLNDWGYGVVRESGRCPVECRPCSGHSSDRRGSLYRANFSASWTGRAHGHCCLHELVHYRRGDQWIRWLELVSLGLYWWHPVAWLLRREIRLAEELACDACVVSQRPTDRRAYAEMLVKTVAFLSADDLPSLATGVGTKGSIEERLRKIMHTAFEVRVSRRMKVLVCLMAILFLPLAPILIRAQRAGVKNVSRADNGDRIRRL